MIVVAVIAVVMAIAIPSLLNARISANETSAIASLKAIGSANERYRLRYDTYADTLHSLGQSGIVEENLGSDPGAKSGYFFDYWGDTDRWEIVARPFSWGQSGHRSFWADETGVIRFNETADATWNDPPIGQ
jgi:type IV pilus assembly protein PilA